MARGRSAGRLSTKLRLLRCKWQSLCASVVFPWQVSLSPLLGSCINVKVCLSQKSSAYTQQRYHTHLCRRSPFGFRLLFMMYRAFSMYEETILIELGCCFFRPFLGFGWPLFRGSESGPESASGPASGNCWWTPGRASFLDQVLGSKWGPSLGCTPDSAVDPVSVLFWVSIRCEIAAPFLHLQFRVTFPANMVVTAVFNVSESGMGSQMSSWAVCGYFGLAGEP